MPNNWVYAKDQWGDKQYIHPDDVPAAQEQGWQILTDFDEKVDDFVEKNKGIKGAGKVFLGQMADEALGGVPELVYDKTKSPLEIAQKEALKKYHSGWNAAGGVTGFGGGMLIGAPAFKAASEGGKAVTKGVTKMLGAKAAGNVGEKTLKKVAKDVVAEGAGTGAEAALLSTPYAFTEAVLGDPEDASETIMMGVGLGTLFGGAGAMAKGFKNLIGETAKGKEAREFLEGKMISDKNFKAKAEDYAWESLDPTLSQQRKTQAFTNTYDEAGLAVGVKPVEGTREIGRMLIDEGVVTGRATKASMYEKVQQMGSDLGKKVGQAFEQVDSRFGEGAKISKLDIAVNLERKLTSLAAKDPSKKKFVRRVMSDLNDLIDTPEDLLSLSEANVLKSNYQNMIKNYGIDDINYQGLLKEIPREFNVQIRKKIGELDPQALNDLTVTQAKLANVSAARNVLEYSAAREAKNNDFGLNSFVSGAGGASAGAQIGGAPGAIVGGFATMLTREAARRFGNQVASLAYDKSRGLLFAEQAMKRTADELDRIPSILANLRKKMPAKKTQTLEALNRLLRTEEDTDKLEKSLEREPEKPKAVKRANEKLSTWASNAERVSEEVGRFADPIVEGGAPEIGSALVGKMTNAVSYLQQQVPKPPRPHSPFSPEIVWKPSDYDMNVFLEKAAVVENPMIVLDELEQGTLSRAHMHALKGVYPAFHRMITERIQKEAVENPVVIPYNQRIKLSLLIDSPLDISLENESIKYYQSGLTERQDAEEQAQEAPFKASVQIADSMMTENEAMQKRRV